MKGFKKIGSLTDFPPGSAKSVKVGDKMVAVYNVGGSFYATQDECLHVGGPLGDGRLEGSIIICPWHGWQFDVVKGCAVMSEEIRLARYEVKVHRENVFVSRNVTP